MNEPVELVIALTLDDGDDEEVQSLTASLRSQIKKLDVWSVENVSAGNAPAESKSVDLKALGEIAVTLAPIIIPPLFDLLRAWVAQKPSTPMKLTVVFGPDKYIEYDPTHISPAELEKLVKSYQSSNSNKKK